MDDFYRNYKHRKLLDKLIQQNKTIEYQESIERQKPSLLRKQALLKSMTMKVRTGRKQREIEVVQQRMKAMECHEAVFVEPMPNFDHDKTANWGDVAGIIFKAVEKEQNAANNPDLKPEQITSRPYERFKDCVKCCNYLTNDMQLENILDVYDLRQDAELKDTQDRHEVQKILDIKNDKSVMRRMKFPCFNVKLSVD